ncbi:hypothetical protein, partial [Bordetella pertussis]|uniref:hypothetical protein n=1 Tax=Bordetella pertussis TaxID=520 RepID=UPI001C9E3D22
RRKAARTKAAFCGSANGGVVLANCKASMAGQGAAAFAGARAAAQPAQRVCHGPAGQAQPREMDPDSQNVGTRLSPASAPPGARAAWQHIHLNNSQNDRSINNTGNGIGKKEI